MEARWQKRAVMLRKHKCMRGGTIIAVGDALTAAAVMVPMTGAFAASQVGNGSFESSVHAPAGCPTFAATLGNWTPVFSTNPAGSQPGTIVTNLHHGGTRAALVDNEPLNGDVDGANGFTQGIASLSSTKKAKLSAWV
jgi:hypothetical protein